MQLGLVTYNGARSGTCPRSIKNLQKTGFRGVELRTTHKHGVEPSLDESARKDVAKRFADSGVELVGLGTTCEYHSPDAAVLKKNIEETKAFIKLCHDVGGSGVKVRPNGLPAGVPTATTLEQIGRSLDEVAAFGEGYGVEIRLEVHGRGTSEMPNIRKIMDVSKHPGSKLCWNCNAEDLDGAGLAANFEQRPGPAGHDPHPRPDQRAIPGPSCSTLLEASQLRRLDAAGRRLANRRPDPRDAVLPAAVGRRWRLEQITFACLSVVIHSSGLSASSTRSSYCSLACERTSPRAWL